ncbi:MAG: succinate dehydrogenase, cytochrome b556 subunit [Elusimicrobiota bacterium]
MSLLPLYKGGSNQTASLLHQLAGAGVFIFLITHIADTAVLAYSADLYNKVILLYRSPAFKLGEIGLIGCVLFHAFNGVRLILLDVFTSLIPHHRALIWIEAAGVFLIWAPTSLLLLLGHR